MLANVFQDSFLAMIVIVCRQIVDIEELSLVEIIQVLSTTIEALIQGAYLFFSNNLPTFNPDRGLVETKRDRFTELFSKNRHSATC